MRRFAVVGLLLVQTWFAGGCACARIVKTLPDGSKLSASTYRCFWQTQNFRLLLLSPEGWRVECDLDRSATDTNAVKAGAEGLAKGAVKGLL